MCVNGLSVVYECRGREGRVGSSASGCGRSVKGMLIKFSVL